MNKSASSAGKKKLTPKEIKERLTDDSLDLSVCSLELVPVKEIADLTKVRKLNLSYNLLVSLPEDFIKLQLIRELDLSKNKLTALPKNFGSLVNLKNLDLLGNELTTLPSSFCELKALQWLDLKDNPLSEGLKKAAGDCFNEAQCKKCAASVIVYMKQVAAEEERRRQLDLKKKREEQTKKDAEEKEKAEVLREQRKVEREERRRVNEQKRKQIFDEHNTPLHQAESNGNGVSRNGFGKAHGEKSAKHTGQSKSLAGQLFSAVTSVLVLAVIVALLFVFFSNTCSKGSGGGNTSTGIKFRQTLDQQKWLKPALELVDKHVCPAVVRYRPLIRNLIKPLDLV